MESLIQCSLQDFAMPSCRGRTWRRLSYLSTFVKITRMQWLCGVDGRQFLRSRKSTSCLHVDVIAYDQYLSGSVEPVISQRISFHSYFLSLVREWIVPTSLCHILPNFINALCHIQSFHFYLDDPQTLGSTK